VYSIKWDGDLFQFKEADGKCIPLNGIDWDLFKEQLA